MEQQTTAAEVTVQVKGKTDLSLSAPTPKWATWIVRALTWITALWALVAMNFDLKDFGMTEHTQFIILKNMAALSGVTSVLARFLGVKQPNLTQP